MSPDAKALTPQQQLERLETVARAVADEIRPMFDAAGAGFAVLGFDFAEGGWATYASNAKREDMVKALREMADHLEANTDIPPAVAGRDPEAG